MEDIKSQLSTMSLDDLKALKDKYNSMAQIATEMFDERYASQGFPKYDELPAEIKEEILKYDPLGAQLVSRESKALTDRYMTQFCDAGPTPNEIQRYFEDKKFDGTNGFRIIIDNYTYDLILYYHGDFALAPVPSVSPGYITTMTAYSPKTYHDIFSQRTLCMKNNAMYADEETYKICKQLLTSENWKKYTIFFSLLMPENRKRIDKIRGTYFPPPAEPLKVINDKLLKRLKRKYSH